MSLEQAIGFSYALTAMVLYGLYMVPRKKCDISQGSYTFWMGSGILISTAVLGLMKEQEIPCVSMSQFLLIVSSGIVWGTGTLAYSSAVKHIGLSRSTPIKNTSAILGTAFGIIIFKEFDFTNTIPLLIAIIGSIAIVISATMLGRIESFDEDDSNQSTIRSSAVTGILASVWAAIAYSIYTIPMKYCYSQDISPSAFLFYMGQGCFIGMSILSLILKTHKNPIRSSWHDRGLAGLSGMMWAIGSLCANMAVDFIGIAITWPLTKNTIVAIAYGTLILREVDIAKHRYALRMGIILSVAGIVLLAYAMGK